MGQQMEVVVMLNEKDINDLQKTLAEIRMGTLWPDFMQAEPTALSATGTVTLAWKRIGRFWIS